MFSDSLVVGFSGAVSAIIALFTGYFAAYMKVKAENLATKEDFREALSRIEQNTRVVESIKADIETRQTVQAELRSALRDLTISLESFLHSICWFTWDCVYRQRVDAAFSKKYDEEAHRLIPEILGNFGVVTMLQPKLYGELAEIINSSTRIDAAVGEAVILAEKELPKGLAQITIQYQDALAVEQNFRAVLGRISRSGVQPAV